MIEDRPSDIDPMIEDRPSDIDPMIEALPLAAGNFHLTAARKGSGVASGVGGEGGEGRGAPTGAGHPLLCVHQEPHKN
jgi:hypothetical protein